MIASTEDIKKLYEGKLKSRLFLIEKERKRILSLYTISLLVFIILILTAQNEQHDSTTNVFILGITLILLLLSAIRFHLRLKKQFKSKIIEELIKVINPNWSYDHENHINENRVMVSNIFNHSEIDRFKGDDYFEGEVQGHQFQASEIKIEKRIYTNKKRKYVTIFQGMFIEIKLNQKTKAETYIFSDITEKLIGKWLGDMVQSINFGRGELVKLENPEFEKHFRVHSDDQVQARVLITPLFMEKLLKLNTKLKVPFHMAHHGDCLYVAINYRNELLEPKILTKMDTFAAVREAYDHLILPKLFIDQITM